LTVLLSGEQGAVLHDALRTHIKVSFKFQTEIRTAKRLRKRLRALLWHLFHILIALVFGQALHFH
jgi:hypothetical protein